MSPPRLTLFLPGLLGPPGAQAAEAMATGLEAPALERLLSRGARFDPGWPDDALEGMLFRIFDVETVAGRDWPVAPVTHAMDAGAPGRGWLMRADPVHLRADLSAVHLHEATGFPLYRGEAESLAGVLNRELAAHGLAIEVLHAKRWYVRLPGAPGVSTCAPSRTAGRALEDCLPSGAEAARWRALLNESQMILHDAPANIAREDRGEPPVNSVWFWGAGTLPPHPERRFDRIWSDDALAHALAQLAASEVHALPEDASRWLQRVRADGDDAVGEGPGDAGDAHLAVLDVAAAPARRTDVDGWREALTAIERDWLAPLWDALRSGAVQRLTLLTDRGACVHLSRADTRRFWRRTRSLAQLMAAAG